MKNGSKSLLGFLLIGVLIVLVIILKQYSTGEKSLENDSLDSTYSHQNTETSKTESRQDLNAIQKDDNSSNQTRSRITDEYSSSVLSKDKSFEDKLAESRIYASNITVGDPEFRTSDRKLYISDGDETHEIKTIGNIVYRGDNPEAEKLLHDIISDDPVIRAEAVAHLGFIDNGAFEPVIISFLKTDPFDDVRERAAASLETHEKSSLAVHALVDSVKDPSEDVRTNVLASLRAIRNGQVKQELTGLLAKDSIDQKTADQIRILLDRYYLKHDPFKNPADAY